MAQANKEYEDAEKFLITFQDDINYSVLIQVASKMLWILGNTMRLHNNNNKKKLNFHGLDAFPSYAGSYYILSYLLYIVNRFEDALDVMDMGRLCSTSFPPFNGNCPFLSCLKLSLKTFPKCRIRTRNISHYARLKNRKG